MMKRRRGALKPYLHRFSNGVMTPAVLCLFLVANAVFYPCSPALGASRDGSEDAPVVGSVPQKAEDAYIPDPRDFVSETFVENLEIPWELVFLPDGRALTTEREGRIRLIRGGKLQEKPYATIDVTAVGEGGLMGLALHPDFPGTPYVYIMYTYRDGIRIYNRVERLRDTGSTLVPEKVIIEKIPGSRVHNGGRIAFGPDNMLYVCTGDARQPEIAQDLDNLGGKILRLTPDGAVPGDNPFGRSPVYAYGLRNPQGLAWDPRTKALFCSDHGPSGEFGLQGKDSIKRIIKGGNYGWPLALGKTGKSPYIDPVVYWPEATPPAGMTFFRGKLYVTSLRSEALIRIGLRRTGDEYEAVSIERLYAQGRDNGIYGRLRGVVAGPDSELYIFTSNRDGRGDLRKEDDKIIRLVYRQGQG